MTSMPESTNNVLTKYLTSSGRSKAAQSSSALPYGTEDELSRTNDEEDVQDFSDVDSNAAADSNIECLLIEDGFESEDDEALEFEPAFSHLTGDDDNDLALEAAFGLD